MLKDIRSFRSNTFTDSQRFFFFYFLHVVIVPPSFNKGAKSTISDAQKNMIGHIIEINNLIQWKDDARSLAAKGNLHCSLKY